MIKSVSGFEKKRKKKSIAVSIQMMFTPKVWFNSRGRLGF